MNTSCKQTVVISSNGMAGNQNAECGEPTFHGRSHCAAHRAEELRRLSRLKWQAYADIEKAFVDYLSEGFDP